jgi:putative transcriptional regulator
MCTLSNYRKEVIFMENHFASIISDRLLSITKVAEDTGVSRQALTRLYYKRTKKLDSDVLIALSDYLQVPVSDIINHTPATKESEQQ